MVRWVGGAGCGLGLVVGACEETGTYTSHEFVPSGAAYSIKEHEEGAGVLGANWSVDNFTEDRRELR